MTITVDLAPEAETRSSVEAARQGQDAQEFARGLLERQVSFLLARPTEPPTWLVALKPRDPANGDKNGLREVIRKWPGDESDAAVAEALQRLS